MASSAASRWSAYDGAVGRRIDARSAVSRRATPAGSPARSRKAASNPTLCPTRQRSRASPTNPRKAATAVAASGAPTRSASRIPVRRAIADPTGRPGSTKVTKASPISMSPDGAAPRRTAPISTMRSRSGSNPVVSRSTATRRFSVGPLF